MRLTFWTAFWVFILDQFTKYVVVHGLGLITRLQIDVWPPYVTFRMAWNRGVNFGLFSGLDMRWVLIALALVISGVVLYWVHRDGGSRWTHVSAGLLVGGAIGNVVDRLLYGAVADFLNMSCCGIDNPYAFNVADIAIFAGAIGLVIFTGPSNEGPGEGPSGGQDEGPKGARRPGKPRSRKAGPGATDGAGAVEDAGAKRSAGKAGDGRAPRAVKTEGARAKRGATMAAGDGTEPGAGPAGGAKARRGAERVGEARAKRAAGVDAGHGAGDADAGSGQEAAPKARRVKRAEPGTGDSVAAAPPAGGDKTA